MGWIEYLLIVAGSSLEIFVAMECQGSLVQKINKKQHEYCRNNSPDQAPPIAYSKSNNSKSEYKRMTVFDYIHNREPLSFSKFKKTKSKIIM